MQGEMDFGEREWMKGKRDVLVAKALSAKSDKTQMEKVVAILIGELNHHLNYPSHSAWITAAHFWSAYIPTYSQLISVLRTKMGFEIDCERTPFKSYSRYRMVSW